MGGGLFELYPARFMGYVADSKRNRSECNCGEQKANIALQSLHVPRADIGVARLRRDLQGVSREHPGGHRDAAGRLGDTALRSMRGATPLSPARDLSRPTVLPTPAQTGEFNMGEMRRETQRENDERLQDRFRSTLAI